MAWPLSPGLESRQKARSHQQSRGSSPAVRSPPLEIPSVSLPLSFTRCGVATASSAGPHSELEDVQLLWGPVKCLCSCLRDVCDCRWECVCVECRGPALGPGYPHGACGGRMFSVTYLPASAPVKGPKRVVTDVAGQD